MPDPAPVVLWDIDGTLLLAGSTPREALQAAVGSTVGQDVDLSAMPMGGLTDRRIVTDVLRGLGASADGEAVRAVLDAYVAQLQARSAQLRRQVRVLPGVPDVLRGLDGRGVRQLVLTGNARACAQLKLDAAGLADLLDLDASGFGDHRLDKAQVAAEVLAGGGLPTGRPWVVGDTPVDLACARSVGGSCLLVATGRYDLAALTALGPELALADLRDTGQVLAALTSVVPTQPVPARPAVPAQPSWGLSG